MSADELHHHYGLNLISDMDTRQFPLGVCAENFRLRLPKTLSVDESWRFSTQMRRKSRSFTGWEVLRRHSLDHMTGFGDAHLRRILDA